MSVGGSAGIQYSLADAWSAYAKYSYTANLNGDFAPGDLVQPVNGSRAEPVGNQIIQSLTVGIMVLF
jgi:hypothetical protein